MRKDTANNPEKDLEKITREARHRAEKRKRPREDYGFFGPDSVCWKVWGHPTSALIGGHRFIVIQMFEVVSVAGVFQNSVLIKDAAGRASRTIPYFLNIVYGDGRAAVESSEMVRRIHDHVKGIEPISGQPYAANDAPGQLWVHTTTWHSMLYAYEIYGGGGLSTEEENRYWAECAIAAEMQTIAPLQVPRNRQEVRDYWTSMRPKLCTTEGALDLWDTMFQPELPGIANPIRKLVAPVVGAMSKSLIPRHLRRLGGLQQSPLVDFAAINLVGQPAKHLAPVLFAVANRNETNVLYRLFAFLGIEGRERALRGEKPLRPVVVTPAEAREQFRLRQTAKRSAAAQEPDNNDTARRKQAVCPANSLPCLTSG
jgi:uncharacterized protein (DUF2236 family)